MSLERFPSIEPLGGFSDKGRDAVHVSESAETTIFAYSVREDWRAKLAEDASKIKKHGHTCDQLVFITTASFTAGERDEATAFISDEFGWRLKLYGSERLRVLLDARHPKVKADHPQIFPPGFLALQSKVDNTTERNHLFICSAPEDSAFADWLARKLTAEGYLVWYERLNLLGGETYPNDVDEAIKYRSFRILGLYSQSSLQNPEVMRQLATAFNVDNGGDDNALIPLSIDGVNRDQLDRATSSLVFIPFEETWASGLQQLLKKLETIACPKLLPNGRTVAAESYLERRVMSDQTELLYSNCLEVKYIPEVIHRFEGRDPVPSEESKQWQLVWAHRQVDPKTFLSFHQPPASIKDKYGLESVGNRLWRAFPHVDGIRSQNLVSELVRKSLIVKCQEKGLQFCPQTGLLYFPWEFVDGSRLKFTRPDGSKSHLKAAGERKFWRPSGSVKYRYYLAPAFFVAQDLSDDFAVLVQIKIRFSDTSGETLPGRMVNSRRKHLCKDWWNKEWLNRLLAVCQYLAEDGEVSIGTAPKERVVLDSVPICLNAPLSIDEAALGLSSYERSELLTAQDGDEVDEGDSEVRDG